MKQLQLMSSNDANLSVLSGTDAASALLTEGLIDGNSPTKINNKFVCHPHLSQTAATTP